MITWTFYMKDGFVSPPYEGRGTPISPHDVINDEFGNVVYLCKNTKQILFILEKSL